MRIATWNVNGVRARQAELLSWLERERPEIVCLQELKAAPEQIPAALRALDGYWSYWHGRKGYSGVSIHLARAAFADEPRFSHPDFDHESRIVVVEAGPLAVASIYVPNGGKDYPAKLRFLEALDAWAAAAEAGGRLVVLCGDLNVTATERDVHPRERNPYAIGQRAEERDLLARLVSRGLCDLGRHFAPDDDSLYTWWAPWRNMRQRNIGWRLDYVLASAPLVARARGCVVLREQGTSDHAPVVASFESLPA
jgi:exodeoxyribonuclease-3